MRVVMSIIALWSSYNAFIETDMSSVDFLKGQSCCPLMYWCIICEKVTHGLEVERSHQIVLGLLIILTPLHEELIHQSDSLHSWSIVLGPALELFESFGVKVGGIVLRLVLAMAGSQSARIVEGIPWRGLYAPTWWRWSWYGGYRAIEAKSR